MNIKQRLPFCVMKLAINCLTITNLHKLRLMLARKRGGSWRVQRCARDPKAGYDILYGGVGQAKRFTAR